MSQYNQQIHALREYGWELDKKNQIIRDNISSGVSSGVNVINLLPCPIYDNNNYNNNYYDNNRKKEDNPLAEYLDKVRAVEACTSFKEVYNLTKNW
jgi:hypothetical protein